MVKSRKFVLAKRFDGEPKQDDFKLVEEELPPLKDGEVLAEAVWLSVDPYMRLRGAQHPIGETMFGSQVARIIESRRKDAPVGNLVIVNRGWQDKVIIDVTKDNLLNSSKPFFVPDFQGLPESLALGVLGMPGNTAYFLFLDICKPKPGEVVVVSGAAGAVGSIVGQIAKIKGCKVIGFAGTDEKVKWLSELGFDYAFNYKTTDISEDLKSSAPNGVDCYFDNVGGSISNTVISHMNQFGRVAVCGSISQYNSGILQKPAAPNNPAIAEKQLKVEGHPVMYYDAQWMEGINQLLKWVLEGKVKYRETITEGFVNMPKAFIEMLQGKNTGKAIVRA